ncbi:MAG: toll/interleukin-1 receptor domain-containing protein [Cyclobacteriaceae bacterium]|nr:toll/interleukin-1 receptor domain-containing protein [Cyclobacteriaceae bacterium]
MKAFISYSLNDHDQYILTLLASELQKKGFVIKQSNDFHTEMSSLTKVNINKAQLFIGIISGTGIEKERVQKEWRLANVANIPSILLIENTVKVSPDFKFSYIVFDRHNPNYAIEELKRRITQEKKNDTSDALAWVLGGAALLAIISLLSKDD